MNDEEFRSNLLRGEEAISSALGFGMNPKQYRPHGGFYNSRQERICSEEGYIIVPVSVRVYDAVTTAAGREKVVNKTVDLIKKRKGGLILLHDGRDSYSLKESKLQKNPNGAFNRSWIPETVEEIINALMDGGYTVNGPDILDITGLSGGAGGK
jgi:peptidoglycan/xylan/chitin deacetylase (PgdA/CDA1 family)